MKKILTILIAISCQFAYCQEILLPEINPNDIIVNHYAYTLNYNEEHEQAERVAYYLTKDRVYGTMKRTNDFRPDSKVKTGSATLADYKGSGYDRGHLAPAADMKWLATAMSESFYMSNMSPQRPGFNRGIWKRLEQLVRSWAIECEQIYIVTGPVLKGSFKSIGLNQISVPECYYKVVLNYKKPELKGIGLILANTSSKKPLRNYAVTIDYIESITGIDFFVDLLDNVEEVIESNLDLNKWSFNVSNYSKPKTPKSVMTIPASGDRIVYVTKTGKKYHRDGCSLLSRSKIPIKLEDAKKRGYEPCRKCNPPQ